MFGAAPQPAPVWPQQPTNGFTPFPPQQNNTFVSEANFSNVFNNTDTTAGQQPPQQPGKVLTGDLDSSLAQLANNLSINKATAPKPMQWNSPKNGSKAGVAWSPQPMQATTGAGYRPMGPGMTLPPMHHTLPHTYHPPHYVVQQPGMVMGMPGAQPPMMGQPMRPPMQPQPTNQFS
ncbi:hypothetical protein MSG28_012070 [Choristoneura fumiferana]|uniref:Uncharacterized protein n=1 Tax=Choristoneura fumiferana TaxID=7141 RepID=A0ACC0KNX4_CHOFU|nr:hypothetical protein MSG28_012070 [Choristoneura fumiferana]